MSDEATLLRSVLGHMRQSVAVYDREGRIVYLNPMTERMFGVALGDVVAKRLWDLFPDAVGNLFHQAFARVAAGGPAETFDHYYEPFDKWFRNAVELIGDHVHVVAHDIAAERGATRRLQSLLDVTVKLASAESEDAIAHVVVDEGIEALDADLAGMWLRSPRADEAVLQRHRGLSSPHKASLGIMRLSRPSPVADCMNNGRPIWIRSRAQYAQMYPDFEAMHRPDPAPPIAFALLPLIIEGRAAGCLSFTFYREEHLTVDEQTYFEVLASHTAEALRRARLYAQLRDVSETREAMIQASPAAIMLLDGEATVQAWNPAAERIFGWKATEVIGQRLPAISLGQEGEFQTNLEAIIAGASIERKLTKRRRRSGELLDVELYAAPVHLIDGRTLCLAMVFDVSERVRIEAGRRLISRATALLTRSLDAKRTLGEVVALVADEFGGQCTVTVNMPEGPPLQVVGGEPATTAPAATAEPFGPLPLFVGTRTLGNMSLVAPLRPLDKLDEATLLDLASHLATAVDNARLYEEARSARREAEASSGAKDQFLAMLGHELRNPLAPITTALHLMQLRAPEHLERERAVIERQVGHLTRLVDDLLDVSRITRGKVELRRKKTNLAEIVAKAIETVSPLLEERQHRLDLNVPDDLEILADPTRLAQIVTNLVSNAAKYSDKGGDISVHASARADTIVLVVKDNGFGIAADMLPLVFDVFVQAPQTSARKSGGLGLGLAIVRSLVELHDGTVTASSEGLGKGAEFVVTFPAAPLFLPEDFDVTPTWTVPRTGKFKRVLIVDDNQDAAELLSELLSSQGHEVMVAFDGPSALHLAVQFAPEVAVLDIGLPVMDGYELAQRLRAMPELSLQRLIALTGYGQASDRARSRAAGFDAHVAKPVSVEEIVRLVESAK